MTHATIPPRQAESTPDPAQSSVVQARPGVWTRWHLGALLAHLVLSAIFTWPLVLNFLPGAGTLVPGVMLEDRDQNLWNLWWVRYALLHGQNPYVTNMIWYPTPISLYYHTLNIFNGLLATPLLSIFSLTTVYNIIVLFSFVMGGYGAFLLVYYLCRNRWAALVGSVVFAYSAYHIATMRSLLQLVSLEWVPFFLLFLLQAVYRPDWESRRDFVRWLWRWALPAGFALFLISLVDWYYTMYSLMLAGFLALYILLGAIWRGSGRGLELPFKRSLGEPLLRIALCLGIYLVLISPILIPTLQELRSTSYMLPVPDSALSNSADLLAFFQPVRGQNLWGQYFTNRRDWPFGSNRYEVYLTYTALFLVGVALFATRVARPRATLPGSDHASSAGFSRLPGKWFWAALAAIFFSLALGPVLQVNGAQIEWLFTPTSRLFMPYNLIELVPFFNISRSPDRFDMPLTLCLGILAGYGTNVLLNTWRVRWRFNTKGAALSLGAIALILVELFQYPYPQRTADIPQWYYRLGQEPGNFSILELPPQNDYWHGAYRMYFQTANGKPIFGGYISREYPHPFLQSTPGYQELTYVDGSADMFASGPNEWYSAFAQYDTRYIVLQKARLPDRQDPPVDVSPSRDEIKRILGPSTQPVYSDSQVEVYKVPQPAQRVAYMSVGEGWQPREAGPNGSFRWMGNQATIIISSPQAEQAYLSFRATSLGQAKRLQIYLGGRPIFDEQVGGLQTFQTPEPLSIPAGVSTLTFVSPGGTDSPARLGMGNDPRQLSFALLDAKLVPVSK